MYSQQQEHAILISKLFLNKSLKIQKTHNTHIGRVLYDFSEWNI